MTPGVYDNITNEQYHGGPGISKSGLDLIHRSPMHYHFATTAANDNQPTPAQAIGTAFHALLLEPALFAQTYCLGLRRQDVPDAIEDREVLVGMVAKLNESRLPKLATGGAKAEQIERIIAAEKEMATAAPDKNWTICDSAELEARKAADLKLHIEELNKHRPGLLTTSGNRHELAEILRANGVEVTLWSDVLATWNEANGHRTVLSQEQWDQLMAMRDSVMDHPAARALLTAKPGVAEQSVYWVDPVTGELCRCRPDFWRIDDIIVDVKTTDDASPEGFAKSIANWRYDVQDPFYRDGIKIATGRDIRGFVFLAVEKKAPYAVGVYVLDPESIELGRLQYRADLNRYAECKAASQWPGYGDKIQTISLPKWHLNKNAYLMDAQ